MPLKRSLSLNAAPLKPTSPPGKICWLETVAGNRLVSGKITRSGAGS